jgi:phospholipid/cholesterol/gamma-HCH transport system permease protein
MLIMSMTSNALPSSGLLGPVGKLGRVALAIVAYVGGVTMLTCAAAGSMWRTPEGAADPSIGLGRSMLRQLAWMLGLGLPLVGLVHIAMGSFLALQAYYGSTFIDGTGAVVGVGLLRNLGGMMTGMTLSGILAARIIPELRRWDLHGADGGHRRPPWPEAPALAGRRAAPRIVAAALAAVLLSQWGVAVGTLVGWQAAMAMMGLPTETFFLMMVRMLWFRDVVGLAIKGLLFGMLPAAICCYEGLRSAGIEDVAAAGPHQADAGGHLVIPVFRATCLGIVAILIVNLSWFMLVYHAVPFYGPTLLKPPSP